MKIGIRKSPHLALLAESILAAGDTFTSTYDTGADFWLAWGWPQAEQVARDNGGVHERIICVDAHPFALMAGDTSGDRIFQLGNWGALARYPDAPVPWPLGPVRATSGGEVLVIGQVYTKIQAEHGLVDVWHTGGYEQWVRSELAKPMRRFRKHPRVWAIENPGELQPTLAMDLYGCAGCVTWNSTAGIHARMLGYPSTAVEPHGWAHMSMAHLAALRQSPHAIRSGLAWGQYREWLLSLSLTRTA